MGTSCEPKYGTALQRSVLLKQSEHRFACGVANLDPPPLPSPPPRPPSPHPPALPLPAFPLLFPLSLPSPLRPHSPSITILPRFFIFSDDNAFASNSRVAES